MPRFLGYLSVINFEEKIRKSDLPPKMSGYKPILQKDVRGALDHRLTRNTADDRADPFAEVSLIICWPVWNHRGAGE